MKKLLTSLLAITLLAGCSSKPVETEKEPEAKLETIIVGASTSPHAIILESTREALKAEGFDLVIKEFDDYIIPNTALENGELDANYFQHEPYLLNFNDEYKTDLSSVLKIHFEPLGIYAGKNNEAKQDLSIDDIAENAIIAVPNDGTNEARALQLLQAQGIIKLKDGVGLNATKLDIIENPKNVDIKEIEAKGIAAILADVDYALINGNYALSANVTDKICVGESVESEGAQTFANVLAVKTGNEETAKTLALKKVLTSSETKAFINKEFGSLVVPVFE